MRFVSLLVVYFLLLSATASAQTANATITGTISDPSGAVIANAPVTVRNVETGQLYATESSATGNYTVPQLPVGRYEMSVSVPGFKTYNRVGFSLAAAQILREDVVLEVGSSAEAVTVTAEASLLKTESGELAHNVTVAQMQNLPILTVGGAGTPATSGFRDPFSLALLVPGIQYGANATMIVNGNPDDTIQIRVEGMVAGNTGGLRQYTGQSQPSVDAIQEVAVQTSNYAAEFGTVGGAVFNVQMKSGTNEYHGSGYNYMANDAINAHQPYTGLRTQTRRNDYGGTLGGPIWIPWLYRGNNRSFFFWSFEQFRENLMVRTTQTTVPIEPYRVGNFAEVILGSGVNNQPRPLQVGGRDYIDPLGRSYPSGAIFDPNTERTVVCNTTAFPGANCTNGENRQVRDQFPGNAIPVTRFDRVSANVLKLIPLPTGPNHAAGLRGNNFQNPWKSHRTSELPSLKVDHNLNDQHRLAFYWQNTDTTSQYSFPNGNHNGLPLPIAIARGTFIYNKTMRATYTYNVTPTMLLSLAAGWSSNNFSDKAPVTNYDALKEIGLRGATLNRTFPQIITGASQATGGLGTIGVGAQSNSFERRPMGTANLTWVKGNHTMKFGAEYRLEKYPAYGFTNVSGTYTFGSNSTIQSALQGLTTSQGSTGFQFASFLLGHVTGVTLSQPIVSGTSKTQFAWFVQDSWKVTRRLTLDYGLRWDYGTYAREHYGRNGNLNLNIPNPSAGGHPGGLVFEATCNCRFARNYPYAYGPRIGVAYQLDNKTVLRGGFGAVYNSTGLAAGSTSNSATGGTPGFGQWIFQFSDGIPADVRPVWPDFSPNLGHTANTVIGAPQFIDPNAGRPPRQWQWSVGLQREVTRDLVVEASYVANRGVWWPAGLSTVNEISEEQLALYGFQVGNSADSVLLRSQWGQLNAAQRSTLASRGVFIPYNGFPTNQTVRQSLRRFPQYNTGIIPAQAPLGKTWYDSLQVVVTKRFSYGLAFNANYTFSKSLDAMSSPDIFNRDLAKNLGNDLPHQFRMNIEYTVPRLQRGIFENRVLSEIFSDWGVGWYMQYQSAPTLGRPGSTGTDPLNNWLGRGPGPAQLKKDENGKYMNPYAVNWVDYDGKVHPEPLDLNCRCYDPTKTIVLNPNVWENVPNGQWAADFTELRFFRGIRQPQENANLSRNFRFGPERNIVFHIRIEMQNVFNRLRLPQPALGNFTAVPTQQDGMYTGGFGTLVPQNGTAGSRTGTFIARIQF